MGKIERIVGPPGCGKTTAILDRIEKACEVYFPERIGACSLTNTAVNEMRLRVLKASGIDSNALQNMNTMHGLCFRLLEMEKKNLAEAHMDEFLDRFRRWDLVISRLSSDSDMSSGSGEDMPTFNKIQINRQLLTSEEDWSNEERALFKDWRGWMEEEGYIDFTGMLEKVLERELTPNVDILFVDEAQDQSPLQNSISRMWGDNVSHVVFSGDANQAIFRFAGSDARVFTSLHEVASSEVFLSQSYRVPQAVLDVSEPVLGLASDREVVPYKARLEGGEVVQGAFHGLVSEPDLTLPGTHMLIARCRYRLDGWMAGLEDNGFLYHNPYRPADHAWNPTGTLIFDACRTYRKIASGQPVTGTEFKRYIKKLVVKGNLPRGFKSKIDEKITARMLYDLFDICQLGLDVHVYDGTSDFVSLFGRPESKSERLAYEHFSLDTLLDNPRVIIGTIHSVKGGEADHVWADNIITRTIVNEMEENEDAYNDEVRCCYVAVTRARESFGILQGRRGFQNPIYEVCV